MPITQAKTAVVNLDKDTTINGIKVGRGNNSVATNTIVGTNVLNSNTLGAWNTAIGSGALQNNTTGNENTASGLNALQSNTDGYLNVANGSYALMFNTLGWENTGVGASALQSNTEGSYNTAHGSNALLNNTIGNVNTAVGSAALQSNTSGSENTALGAIALSGGNFSNGTGVGYNSQITASNQVQLGNSATTTYAYGAVQNRSDSRDKSDIRDTQFGLDFVKSLRPVDFKWDMREDYRPVMPTAISQNATEDEKIAYKIAMDKWNEDSKLSNLNHNGSKKLNRYHHGLIAQELEAVLKSKGIDFGGFQDHSINGGDEVLSIGYEELIAPLIKAVQELSSKVEALESK